MTSRNASFSKPRSTSYYVVEFAETIDGKTDRVSVSFVNRVGAVEYARHARLQAGISGVKVVKQDK